MKKSFMRGSGGMTAYFFEGLRRPFPSHFHASITLCAPLTGNQRMTAGVSVFKLHEGDVLLLPPLCPHSCTEAPQSPLDWGCIQIPPGIMPGVAKRLGRPVLIGRDDPLAKSCVEILRHRLIQEAPALDKDLAAFLPGANSGSASQRWLKLEEWLARSVPERIRLDNMAEVMRMDKYKLIRALQADKGITPYKYLESLRINHAEKLLGQNMSLAECALQSGFYDQAQFTRAFQSCLGITPGLYKKALRRDESIHNRAGINGEGEIR